MRAPFLLDSRPALFPVLQVPSSLGLPCPAPLAGLVEQLHDEKNIRRRVYDALNVLEAVGMIDKNKKQIKWKGWPSVRRRPLLRLASPATVACSLAGMSGSRWRQLSRSCLFGVASNRVPSPVLSVGAEVGAHRAALGWLQGLGKSPEEQLQADADRAAQRVEQKRKELQVRRRPCVGLARSELRDEAARSQRRPGLSLRLLTEGLRVSRSAAHLVRLAAPPPAHPLVPRLPPGRRAQGVLPVQPRAAQPRGAATAAAGDAGGRPAAPGWHRGGGCTDRLYTQGSAGACGGSLHASACGSLARVR